MSEQTLGIIAVYLDGTTFEELGYYKKLSIYAKQMGLSIAVFTPLEYSAARREIHAYVYDIEDEIWTRKWVPIPSLIYDRCRYHGADKYRMLRAFRNRHKLNYMAKPLTNKWALHQVMSEDPLIGTMLPNTKQYTTNAALLNFLRKHKVIYLKPKSGTGGRGIVRLQLKEDNTCVIEGRNANRTIMTPQRIALKDIASKLTPWKIDERYLIQQGIDLSLPNGRVHDYRLLIQKDGEGYWDITGVAGRIGPQRSITSNLHGGGTAISMDKLLEQRFNSRKKISEIVENVNELGYQTAYFLEERYGQLCELGLDIAIDPDGGVWLLEVNPKPSREVFSKIGETKTYRKAIKRPLEYAKMLLSEASFIEK
ncbi:YheC/YheD family protein [Paenibacillus sp. N1-5-1-14]|uniref:YheC/YheD family endospore coat-associated protein n=1 Tax=Paenibacillus radicibacter TaxID=2972488 RepID=UPI002158ECB2|nr:YheC/YheD family protein [Paenibacillus radicibacter]MCR8643693.1 YheC/YheD family protein [Paenibacillus radicibacter]